MANCNLIPVRPYECRTHARSGKAVLLDNAARNSYRTRQLGCRYHWASRVDNSALFLTAPAAVPNSNSKPNSNADSNSNSKPNSNAGRNSNAEKCGFTSYRYSRDCKESGQGNPGGCKLF